MYKAYVMFHKDLSPTLDKYYEDLRNMYSEGGTKDPEAQVIKNKEILEIKSDGLTFFIKENQSDQVNLESKQLAGKAWPEEREELEKSIFRYEITSTEDSGFAHSVELLLLIQSAASLGKIWAYDFTVCSFI